MENDCDVIIVGGGLAGLSTGRVLSKAGINFLLLESSNAIGGRVRTDEVEGYLLDRGFQVFLTAYPEAQKVLDYDQLNLKRFSSGSLIRYQNRFHRFSDPWREPQHLIASISSPIATFFDKLRVKKFRGEALKKSLEEINQSEEKSTRQMLISRGFSNRIIESFFRPFFGGIFLESDLQTSSRKCEFVFRMFSEGYAALPALGMQEIPRQLAKDISPEKIAYESTVSKITTNAGGCEVLFESGQKLNSKAVVIATESANVADLVEEPALKATPHESLSVTNLYFSASEPPIKEATLVLNGMGESDGPINNLCVPTQVSSRYAPDGKSLISVTVLDTVAKQFGDASGLLSSVQQQLIKWFGDKVLDWKHLKTYQISNALPAQRPPIAENRIDGAKLPKAMFLAGDHTEIASINGALVSGRNAAEKVIEYLGQNS